jgi:hypothetical protein
MKPSPARTADTPQRSSMHRARRQLRRGAVAVVASGLLLAACDDPTSTRTPTPGSPSAAKRAAPTAAQLSLTEVTRAVALAMQDPKNRDRVRKDLKASRTTKEHKLHFADYLKGTSGDALLASMAKGSGKNRDEILGQIGKLRTMELYMPVEAHRAAWAGGADLIVASQLKEGEDPVGFRLDGTPVTLSVDHVPTTPTLVIVPTETDFTLDVVPLEWKNEDDQGGQTIGTYRRSGDTRTIGAPASPPSTGANGGVSSLILIPTDPCDDPSAPGCYPPPPPPVPAGTYLDFSRIDHLGEDWPRGTPEIEFHLLAPVAFEGNNGEHLSCSGEHRSGPKWFNQDGNEWRRYGSAAGAMFLRTDYDQYYFNYTANKPIGYQVWEDDNASCDIRGEIGRDEVLAFYDQMRRIYAATAVVVEILSATTWVFSVASVTTIAGAFNSDDDFLGIVVAQANLGYNFPDATHVLMRPVNYFGYRTTDFNGRIRLVNITQ